MTNKYMNITDNETLELGQEISDQEVELLKGCVLEQVQVSQNELGKWNAGQKWIDRDGEEQSVMERKVKAMKRRNMITKVAVAALVVAVATPTAVYAAEKWNLFGGLFGGSDTTPIEPYVESSVVEDPDLPAGVSGENELAQGLESSIYQMENEDYAIAVEKFVYSEATDYGIVQFTVTDKSNNASDWYEVATWADIYEDWDVIDIDEIFAGMGTGRLWFEINGLMHMDGNCYAEQIDEDTTVCYLTFNDMEGSNIGDRALKLSVKESTLVKHGDVEDLTWSQIMKLDVPVGESLPNYTWYDEEGNEDLVLTSVDFLLKDAPDASVSGVDVVLREVSVQFKDGSEYVIHSEKQKKINWLYSTSKDGGSWRSIAKVIDLEEVVSFTVDGKVFHVEDAVRLTE